MDNTNNTYAFQYDSRNVTFNNLLEYLFMATSFRSWVDPGALNAANQSRNEQKILLFCCILLFKNFDRLFI